MEEHKAPAAEIIGQVGDASDAIHVISSDVVEVFRDRDGELARPGSPQHGEIFGETGDILGRPPSATTCAHRAIEASAS